MSTQKSKRTKQTDLQRFHSKTSCACAGICDGAARHMPRASNRELLRKCSYAQTALEWTWL